MRTADFSRATRIAADSGRGFGYLMIGLGLLLFVVRGARIKELHDAGIAEQFERASLLDTLRRPALRLKLRLLQESGVAICDVSSLDTNADEPIPDSIGVRVLVSDARAASLRAVAYAAPLGLGDTAALYFATDPDKAEALRDAWLRRRLAIPQRSSRRTATLPKRSPNTQTAS